ncbi:MAG: hypothetical protein AAFQ29_09885, partial [Pseudomonadota bacterium]
LAQVNVLAVKGRQMIRRDQAARFGSQKTVFPGKRSADPGTVDAFSVPKYRDPGSSPGIRGGVSKSGTFHTPSEPVEGGPGSYARGHGLTIKDRAVFPGERSADPGTVDAFSVPKYRDPGSSPGIRRKYKSVLPGKRSADPGTVSTSSVPKYRDPGSSPGIRRKYKSVFPGKRSADPGTVSTPSEPVAGGPGSDARGHGLSIKDKPERPGKR